MQTLFVICCSLFYLVLLLQASSQIPVTLPCFGDRLSTVHSEQFITDWLEENLFSGENLSEEQNPMNQH